MRSYLQRNLERKIQELNRRDFDGDLKVSFYDISEGKSASVNGSSTGWAASIIKLPVMITVADKIANGELDLETKLLVDHSMVLEETDIVSKLPINSALSVKALLYAMIVRSDNEATNILGKHVGVEEINRQMQSIGMSRSMLGHLLYRGAPRSSNDFNPDGSNITCTDDMVKLMRQIYDGAYTELNAKTRTICKSVMRLTQAQFIRLPEYPQLEVCAKIGEISDPECGRDIHEIGIIENNLIVALMGNKLDAKKIKMGISLNNRYPGSENEYGKIVDVYEPGKTSSNTGVSSKFPCLLQDNSLLLPPMEEEPGPFAQYSPFAPPTVTRAYSEIMDVVNNYYKRNFGLVSLFTKTGKKWFTPLK